MSELTIEKGERRLGKSDLAVGPLAYGCWRFAPGNSPDARRKIETALDLGMTLIDTADIYGLDDDAGWGAAETRLGELLADAPGLRQRMVLATKCGIVPGVPYDSSHAYVRKACEESLRRLQTDVIDLYQIHRPDLLTHPADLARTLAGLRQEGKVREVGVSNHTAAQFDALQTHLPFPIATHQPELSAIELAPFVDGVIDQCLARGVTPLAWSPLAGGRLGLEPAEARTGVDGERIARVIETLDRLAAERGVHRSAIALAFLMLHPSGVIPIIGTQQIERIQECAAAIEVTLTRSEWYDIVEAARGEPLP